MTLNRLISRLDTTEQRISELKVKSIEPEKQRLNKNSKKWNRISKNYGTTTKCVTHNGTTRRRTNQESNKSNI